MFCQWLSNNASYNSWCGEPVQLSNSCKVFLVTVALPFVIFWRRCKKMSHENFETGLEIALCQQILQSRQNLPNSTATVNTLHIQPNDVMLCYLVVNKCINFVQIEYEYIVFKRTKHIQYVCMCTWQYISKKAHSVKMIDCKCLCVTSIILTVKQLNAYANV